MIAHAARLLTGFAAAATAVLALSCALTEAYRQDTDSSCKSAEADFVSQIQALCATAPYSSHDFCTICTQAGYYSVRQHGDDCVCAQLTLVGSSCWYKHDPDDKTTAETKSAVDDVLASCKSPKLPDMTSVDPDAGAAGDQ